MKTVKEISKLTGISTRALRYYDEIGLLTPTERSEAGYRLYDEKALEKLNAILFLRELGIPLDKIKEVINSEDCNYALVLKDYRKKLEQKINKLQGLLGVIDGLEKEKKDVDFAGFLVSDAEKVAESIVNQQNATENAISEIYELVKANMVDGKVGNELLQIYGSKENYLSAVEESTLHPDTTLELQEELKNIYFAFRDSSEDESELHGLVKRLEENTQKMFRTGNARYILLQVAEGYLKKEKNAQILDSVYGVGVTEKIGKAVNTYYGM
ncbi:MAG: MerR family transcriptional regulator [Lachnospiraceae bacterium]|nr:MerR family transcriptional regulator [Lachnospiraceae bacterium]